MTTKITMPQLGESVTEGTVGKWLKREGDRIEKYEPLLAVVTDKVNAEVPSPVAGVVQRLLVPEGETVPIGAELAVVEEAGATAAPPAPAEARPPVPAVPPTSNGAGEVFAAAPAAPAPARPAWEDDAELRRHLSPVVRRLVQEHGIDVAQLHGTGLGGRVTKEDVLNYLDLQRVAAAPAAAPAPALAPVAAAPAPAAPLTRPPAAPRPDEEFLPLTPMRRQIAEHMTRAVQTVPHAWTMVEVDVTGLVKLREAMKDEFRRREGVELTYLPFVVKAVVEALKDFPILNSTWGEDKIILKKRINIGIAVALEDGLVVPVVHDADQKSLSALARAVHDFAERARAGKLAIEDVQGGTCTVNNTGVFGSVVSQPIINTPQAAIVTMEAIVRRPVIVDEAIAIRSIMNMCISFDHRVTDGLTVGRFMQSIKKRLESLGPSSMVW